jgi:Uma2 family endonuclease
MSILINESGLAEQIIADRQRRDVDQHDEVWEGVYVVSPLANNEHQDLIKSLITILTLTVEWPGLGKVYPGVNLSDREEDWTGNYRVPDVAAILMSCAARNRGTHWVGGLSFVVEVASEGDRSRDKIPFYESAGVQELLVIDRSPWALELYRNQGGKLRLVGRSDLTNPIVLESEQVPLTFQLVSGSPRPLIKIATKDGKQTWTI